MLAELFEGLDLECLVTTVAELVMGGADTTEFTSRQRATVNRAIQAVSAEQHSEPLPFPRVTQVEPAWTVWVLRRWDRHDDEATPHATEDSAYAELAAHVAHSWDNVAYEDGVPDQPPSVAREAVQFYYGEDGDGQPDEGYSLYEAAVTGAGSRITALDPPAQQPPADNACQRCGSTGFLARASEWASAPALCVECHEALGTAEAKKGHQCLDGCPQTTDHDGLCLP